MILASLTFCVKKKLEYFYKPRQFGDARGRISSGSRLLDTRQSSGGIFYPYTFCFFIDIANEQVYS